MKLFFYLLSVMIPFLFISCQSSDENSENGTTNQNPVNGLNSLRTSGNSNIIKFIEHSKEFDGYSGFSHSWEIIYDDNNRIKEIKDIDIYTYKDQSSRSRYEYTTFEYLSGNKVQCTEKLIEGSTNSERTYFYSLNSDGYIVSGSTARYEYKYENGYLKRTGSETNYSEYYYSGHDLTSVISYEPDNSKGSYVGKIKKTVLWEGGYGILNNDMNIDINSFIRGNKLMAAGLLGKRSSHVLSWWSTNTSKVKHGLTNEADSQGRPSILSYDGVYNKNLIRIYYK